MSDMPNLKSAVNIQGKTESWSRCFENQEEDKITRLT